MKTFTLVTAICLLTACGSEHKKITIQLLPIPCEKGGESNLFVSPNGLVYLSWVEYLSDTTDALLFSKMENGQWIPPTEIAKGNDWFVNWADFPSLAAQGDWLAAHWLQKSAGGTYDYDVRISQSFDHGKTWQPSFIPHRDSIAAEHGFVTMMPISNKRMLAVWLDGRNTKVGPQSPVSSRQSDEEHGHGGAMTLRTAEFDQKGNLYEEAELDDRICNCCQTDVAMTTNGPVIVYRDRSEHEIRDISIVRKVGGKWTTPHLLHADNWEITGCPVNGPAIAADGEFVAIAWFTSASGKSMVNTTFSKDEGETFSPPVRVDDGHPSGRVDVEILDGKTAAITWLENVDDVAEIRLAKISPKGKIGESHSLMATNAERRSGFPILAKNKNQWLLSWTSIDSNSTVVQTGVINGL